MRHTTGYTLLDRRRNQGVLENLKVDPVKNKSQHKQNGRH
jgi:hypothetical protein